MRSRRSPQSAEVFQTPNLVSPIYRLVKAPHNSHQGKRTTVQVLHGNANGPSYRTLRLPPTDRTLLSASIPVLMPSFREYHQPLAIDRGITNGDGSLQSSETMQAFDHGGYHKRKSRSRARSRASKYDQGVGATRVWPGRHPGPHWCSCPPQLANIAPAGAGAISNKTTTRALAAGLIFKDAIKTKTKGSQERRSGGSASEHDQRRA